VELKIKIDGVTDEQVAEVYQLSLQYFRKEDIERLTHLPVETIVKILDSIDKYIVRFHKRNPEKRSGDSVSWQKNLDELIFIRSEAWRMFPNAEIKDRIKILDQLRRVNRDIAELEGLLAPVKVESSTTLNVAEESRKALKEIFGK